jgi:hypothetical protein
VSARGRRRIALRGAARVAAWSAAVVVGGCVVVEETLTAPAAPIAARPVAIPFGVARHDAHPSDFYYDSVIAQMQTAWLAGDRQRLAGLLTTHERPDAPQWAQESLAGFRRVLRVMDFEALIQGRGELHWPAPTPALGESVAAAVTLGPLPSVAVRLFGGDDVRRARFVLHFKMVDTDTFGTQSEITHTTVVDLPAPVDLGAGEAVRVPFAVDVPAQGAIVRRIVIEVDLMPGHVELDGTRLPNRRVRCAAGNIELLPRGADKIAAQPQAALAAALRLGDAAHFPHVFLAARALARRQDPASTQNAQALLIDRVRLGNEVQAHAAMAALRELVSDPAARSRDREQWLLWWSSRPR